MGDRFYSQQKGLNGYKKAKVGRRLKADIVEDIGNCIGLELPGLSKADVKTLEALLEGINNVLSSS